MVGYSINLRHSINLQLNKLHAVWQRAIGAQTRRISGWNADDAFKMLIIKRSTFSSYVCWFNVEPRTTINWMYLVAKGGSSANILRI